MYKGLLESFYIMTYIKGPLNSRCYIYCDGINLTIRGLFSTLRYDPAIVTSNFLFIFQNRTFKAAALKLICFFNVKYVCKTIFKVSNILEAGETTSYPASHRDTRLQRPICQLMRRQRVKDLTGILFAWAGFTEFQFSYLISIRSFFALTVANHLF